MGSTYSPAMLPTSLVFNRDGFGRSQRRISGGRKSVTSEISLAARAVSLFAISEVEMKMQGTILNSLSDPPERVFRGLPRCIQPLIENQTLPLRFPLDSMSIGKQKTASCGMNGKVRVRNRN